MLEALRLGLGVLLLLLVTVPVIAVIRRHSLRNAMLRQAAQWTVGPDMDDGALGVLCPLCHKPADIVERHLQPVCAEMEPVGWRLEQQLSCKHCCEG